MPDLLQAIATGSSTATLIVLTYLALKVRDLDIASRAAAKSLRNADRKISFLFGKLKMDYEGDEE